MTTTYRLHSILLFSLFALATPPAARASEAAPLAEVGPRVSLDFAGGTLDDFVAALEAAYDGAINLVRPDTAGVTIPAIRVANVALSEVFAAIGNAESRIQFVPASKDATVWAVRLAPQVTPPLMVRSFAVERLLEKYTINDLTTAIGTSWDMHKSIDITRDSSQPNKWIAPAPEPELKFHQETKLLIIRGTQSDLALAENVIQQLTPPRPTTRSPEELAQLRASALELEANRLSLEGDLQRVQRESPDDPHLPALKARLRAIEERIKTVNAAAESTPN